MWYVIQVGGGKEKSAHRLIERFVPEGLMKELFIPQYEIMKRYEGEWRTCTETLLPGYLFVVTNQPENSPWRSATCRLSPGFSATTICSLP